MFYLMTHSTHFIYGYMTGSINVTGNVAKHFVPSLKIKFDEYYEFVM